MVIHLPSDDKSDYLAYFSGFSDIWVFAYGSLLWNSGFRIVERVPALVRGYHRSFCLSSYHYRGTAECPGLVLGLDVGGECHGLALRVSGSDMLDVVSMLWDREMISYAYNPVMSDISVAGEGVSQALMFVIDKEHEQYAGKLSDDDVLSTILRARGNVGSNVDYLFNTAEHLRDLGIEDEYLSRLAFKARVLLESA